ncbi:YciI family protein [Longimicrobium sp.]|uniref:YciI family protein n=1 Tax=Longimicrobium sp. TaxID=2029185 RepID=UPI002E33AE81|nr:YciI family protein [Longimicrobium sp.]HEX6038992.1 YciI family protein [Longimicrobium sp.]
MRYMIMFKADSDTEAAAPACIAKPEMGRFIEQLASRGVLLASEGLQPSTQNAARIRFSGGRMNVVDGPFAEAKELVAGFALVEVPSYESAVELAQAFLQIAGDGNAAEVREVIPHPTVDSAPAIEKVHALAH